MILFSEALTRSIQLLGRGDAGRGGAIAITALFVAVGAAAPLVASETLTRLLFALAGIAAFVAVFWPPAVQRTCATPPPRANFESTDCKPPCAAPARATQRFSELLLCEAPSAIADRAHWARLTAHMSHELRTPLNAVLGFSEIMTNEVFGPMGCHYSDYAKSIHMSGRSLLKTAEDALAITALLTAPETRSQPKTASLSDAIADALAFHAPSFAARGIIVEERHDGVSGCRADVAADAQTVRQIVINLLADAADRSADGSVLAVATRAGTMTIDLTVGIAAARAGCRDDGDSFPILLARTLSDLTGGSLNLAQSADGARTATLRLPAATQSDFFSSY